MFKNVVVLGSNSFSGASFVKYLLTQGCRVIGISRSFEPVDSLLAYKWGKLDDFSFFRADINKDLDHINSILDQEKPSLIFNFAAQSMVAQSWETPQHWFRTNLVAMVKLHNCLRQKDYLDRYIHISTPEVYGNCEGYIKENSNYKPSTPYAVSRAAADMSLKTFYNTYGFPVVTTRAANVYGPGQQLYRIIPRTVLYILLGKKLQLHGGGQSQRSFIHIDDVSDATWQIALHGKNDNTYHISTRETVSVRNLVEIICHKMNVDFNQIVDDVSDRPGKDAAYFLNSDKVRTELDWHDKISLENGLQSVIDWIKREFTTLIKQPLEYIHKP